MSATKSIFLYKNFALALLDTINSFSKSETAGFFNFVSSLNTGYTKLLFSCNCFFILLIVCSIHKGFEKQFCTPSFVKVIAKSICILSLIKNIGIVETMLVILAIISSGG